jgi:protein TonB
MSINSSLPSSSRSPSIEASSSDRLSFTIFLALAFHGLLIFGIAFELTKPNESAPSVTVTLSTSKSSEAPKKADFIAQDNQLGSGTLEDAQQITTNKLSPFSGQTIEQVEPINEKRAAVAKPIKNSSITTISSPNLIEKTDSSITQAKDQSGKDLRDIQSLSREIASLNAKLDKQRQQYAKRPRELVLTAVSTKKARDAAYLNEWTRKIELVGNQNFPAEAVRNKIVGSLSLQSIIKWDGSLIKAEILKSSGKRLLDDAALQIIHRAAPFQPFSPELRKDFDQMAIIRTWNFEISGLSTSQ